MKQTEPEYLSDPTIDEAFLAKWLKKKLRDKEFRCNYVKEYVTACLGKLGDRERLGLLIELIAEYAPSHRS